MLLAEAWANEAMLKNLSRIWIWIIYISWKEIIEENHINACGGPFPITLGRWAWTHNLLILWVRHRILALFWGLNYHNLGSAMIYYQETDITL